MCIFSAQSNSFPAPAALVWYNAAMVSCIVLEKYTGCVITPLLCVQALSDGIHSLPNGVIPFTIAGLVYGTVAAVLRKFLPQRFAVYIPSSIALSLGILLGPSIPLAFLLGALMFRYCLRIYVYMCVCVLRTYSLCMCLFRNICAVFGHFCYARLSCFVSCRLWLHKYPDMYRDLGVPIASGMIAGEGLAGIAQGLLGLASVEQGSGSMAGCYGYPC